MQRSSGGRFRVDPDLRDMAEVFHMPFSARLRYLYLPALTGKKRRADAPEESESAGQPDGGQTS
ncbi:MAG: hypothetical protein K6G16_01310 [Lachnospiraceae bacterium]|nr:hypothetical protein [Lachnospiraceae bacterium]